MVNRYAIYRAKNEFKGKDQSAEILRYLKTIFRALSGKAKADVVYNKKLNRYTLMLDYDLRDEQKIEKLLENHFTFKFWIVRLNQNG